jgi:hypothetical protein
MSKLYKVEMYILDINNVYQSLDNIINDITNATEINFECFNVEKVEFDWDDDLAINYSDCSIEDYRKYFE